MEMQIRFKVGESIVSFVQDDITEQDTEAIVNAANSSLMGGGGVDGAIHRAGGPAILEECKKIVSRIGSLPPGQAVITTGGDLKSRYVIHTVGPIWRGGERNEAETLEAAYKNSLTLAHSKGVKTVAFPSISTGAYGYPVEKAARVAVRAVRDFVSENPLEEVRFVLFSKGDFEAYRKAAEEILGQ